MHPETLVRDVWYLCAIWCWLLIMELTETLAHSGRGSYHTFYHTSSFIKLARCIRIIHQAYMHICLGFHLVQVLSLYLCMWYCQDHQSIVIPYQYQVHSDIIIIHIFIHFLTEYPRRYKNNKIGQICYSWLLVNSWLFDQPVDHSQLTLHWPLKTYFHSFYHVSLIKSLFHWFFELRDLVHFLVRFLVIPHFGPKSQVRHQVQNLASSVIKSKTWLDQQTD